MAATRSSGAKVFASFYLFLSLLPLTIWGGLTLRQGIMMTLCLSALFCFFALRCVALRLPRWPFFFLLRIACFSRPLVFLLLFGPIESPLRFSCATGWLALPAGTGEREGEGGNTAAFFCCGLAGWLAKPFTATSMRFRAFAAMHLHIPRHGLVWGTSFSVGALQPDHLTPSPLEVVASTYPYVGYCT